MQAIHVKPLAATETKGLRFKASGLNLCVVTSNDYRLTGEANAAYVAQQLVDNYNTSNQNRPLRIAGVGQLPDNTYAVLVERQVK